MTALLQNTSFFRDKKIESYTLLKDQGYCNENYLVVADGVKYIVRKLRRDDIDRVFEWQVQHLAFEKGITAEPLVFDSKNGLMVFSFLEGEHKRRLDKGELNLLAKTLQKLHSIKIDAKPITLDVNTGTVEHYQKEYALCHNDFNPQNIFFAEEVKLIDFEYAGINDRYFDLASVCVEFGLDEQGQKVFLETYFEDEYNVDKLEVYKGIYKAVCDEWFTESPWSVVL